MERTTAKHAPRIDDQLEHEEHALTHGHNDEGRSEPRRAEAPSQDEPGFAPRPEAEEPAGGAPGWTEQERRAVLAATFPPSAFPATTGELAALAREAFADDDLVAAVEALPERSYDTVTDLDGDLPPDR